MEFFSPFSEPSLSHWPIHGPQALVKILAFSNFLKESKKPSLSAVNFTCSEPGLIPKIAFGFTPFAKASSTMEAALDKSSYEEFVQEPIKAHSTYIGHPFATALS